MASFIDLIDMDSNSILTIGSDSDTEPKVKCEMNSSDDEISSSVSLYTDSPQCYSNTADNMTNFAYEEKSDENKEFSDTDLMYEKHYDKSDEEGGSEKSDMESEYNGTGCVYKGEQAKQTE